MQRCCATLYARAHLHSLIKHLNRGRHVVRLPPVTALARPEYLPGPWIRLEVLQCQLLDRPATVAQEGAPTLRLSAPGAAASTCQLLCQVCAFKRTQACDSV